MTPTFLLHLYYLCLVFGKLGNYLGGKWFHHSNAFQGEPYQSAFGDGAGRDVSGFFFFLEFSLDIIWYGNS